MRLTCPNCSARYEVADSMIPPAGREVQCSNCSTTWFQPGPRVAAPPSERTAPPPPPAPEATSAMREVREQSLPPVAQPVRNPLEGEAPSARPSPAEAPRPDPVEPAAEPVASEPAPARPARAQIDPSVADILRQEAEREAALRRAEAAPEPVETQDEMALESNGTERAGYARRHGDPDTPEDGPADEGATSDVSSDMAEAAAPRSELLPDIEEINSTLRATGDRDPNEASASDVDTLGVPARRRGQVRRGFFFVLVLAVLATVFYVYAEDVSASVPPAAPYLEAFVENVDIVRFWLDDMARTLASGLDSAESGG